MACLIALAATTIVGTALMYFACDMPDEYDDTHEKRSPHDE